VLSYGVEGGGDKTLVFIHGFGGSRGLWRWQVEEFVSQARCLAIDLPGHGESPWHPLTLSDMADSVVEVMDHEGMTMAHMVASSFGGLVALRIVERAPECVSAVSFTGSLPRFLESEDFPAGLNVERIHKLAGQFKGDVAGVLDMFFRSMFTMKERASGQFSRLKDLRKSLPVPRREALLAVLEMLEAEDLRPVLKSLSVPVQFIQGDQDPICPLAATEKVRTMKPEARIDIVRDCGHFPFLSYPSEFGRLLKEFAGI
jgi:pimeloyl-[acyl-carrier protein] methyl ester esterase